MNFIQQNFAVKVFKLLSNANRLKIVDMISSRENGIMVTDIANALELEMTTTSAHLIRLRENGILRAKQSGNNMHYQIKDERVAEIIKLTKKLA